MKPLAYARRRLAACGMILAVCTAAVAPSKAAEADTILTLSRGAADLETLDLTIEDLEALPQHTLATRNEFADGLVVYKGPLARDVLEKLALAHTENVRLVAANDYYIDVPTSDFHDYEVIFALEADGQRLSLRDKGPIWLMYPLSDHPELSGPVYNARLIWQVVRVEAL